MQISTARRPTNRFIGEVRERDGVGLRYETASGSTGVVWLIRPSDPCEPNQPQQTILGRYLEEAGIYACLKP